jgi:hypothetical protein
MQTKIPLILSTLTIVAAAWVLSSKIPTTKYQGDENRWVSSSHYYASLLIKGDFEKEAWEGKQYDDWGSGLNLHLGQYLLGVPIKFYLKDSPCPGQNKYIYHFWEPYDLSHININTQNLIDDLIEHGYIRNNGMLEYKMLYLSEPSQLNISSEWEKKKT